MPTVTVYTAERMQEIEDESIVDGDVVGDNLILTRHDGGTINAGSVRGPQGVAGPTGDVNITQLNEVKDRTPAGATMMWLFPTAPDGWIFIEGQAIAGANVSMPDLWAAAPAGWKSGTTLTMPNMQGKVPVHQDVGQTEFDTLLETGGAKTTTLVKANVPKHEHGIDHDHGAAPYTTDPDTHYHEVGGPTLSGGALQEVAQTPTGGGVGWNLYGITDVITYGAVGRAITTTDTHVHSGMLDMPAYTGSSEDGTATGLGSTPISILQPYFVVRFIMKT